MSVLSRPHCFLLTVGCNKPSNAPCDANKSATSDARANHSRSDDDHGNHHENEMSAGGTSKATLIKIPQDDRASAEKQLICPVSGALLGSMGTPQKVEGKGQPVWICCDSCKDSLLEDPKKNLAKLKKS